MPSSSRPCRNMQRSAVKVEHKTTSRGVLGQEKKAKEGRGEVNTLVILYISAQFPSVLRSRVRNQQRHEPTTFNSTPRVITARPGISVRLNQLLIKRPFPFLSVSPFLLFPRPTLSRFVTPIVPNRPRKRSTSPPTATIRQIHRKPPKQNKNEQRGTVGSSRSTASTPPASVTVVDVRSLQSGNLLPRFASCAQRGVIQIENQNRER